MSLIRVPDPVIDDDEVVLAHKYRAEHDIMLKIFDPALGGNDLYELSLGLITFIKKRYGDDLWGLATHRIPREKSELKQFVDMMNALIIDKDRNIQTFFWFFGIYLFDEVGGHLKKYDKVHNKTGFDIWRTYDLKPAFENLLAGREPSSVEELVRNMRSDYVARCGYPPPPE